MSDEISDGEWSPWGDDGELQQPLIQPTVPTRPPGGIRNMGGDDNIALVGQKAARTKQYIAAISATMGSLSMGIVLGFSSPAGSMLTANSTQTNSTTPLHLTTEENTWFGSSVNLGALAGGPIAGYLINVIGRRGTMLASSIPFVAAWLLIAFAQNYIMLLIGRIITGLCAGITSLVVPTYIAEIASPDVRGTLGSGFQLMVTIGVLYAYGVGAANLNWIIFVFICFQPVVLYFILMIFTKETPIYLLTKGNEQKAAEALQYFRGSSYNIQTELDMMRQNIAESQNNKITLRDLTKPYILKPLMIAMCLMFFQQFSGINALLFNLNAVFKAGGSDLPEDICSIIVGIVQVIATLCATILVDKSGRKLLLIISSSIMALSLVALGEYFYLLKPTWLPLVSLIIFIAAFSIGFGPIPWLMMGELFSSDIKGPAAGLATMFNWTMSFVVTSIFIYLQEGLHIYGTYWLFSCICIISMIFCICIVPETKGKTLDEITALFGGISNSNNRMSTSTDC